MGIRRCRCTHEALCISCNGTIHKSPAPVVGWIHMDGSIHCDGDFGPMTAAPLGESIRVLVEGKP